MSGAVEGVLLPCPFCGAAVRRLTIGEEEPNNAGGDVIVCTACQASSHVEFGRKENLVSRWNTRTTPPARSYADGVEDAAKWHDAEAAKARESERSAQLLGFWDRMAHQQKLAAIHTMSAKNLRLLSQGGKA